MDDVRDIRLVCHELDKCSQIAPFILGGLRFKVATAEGT